MTPNGAMVIGLVLLTALGLANAEPREYGGFHTRERVANLRANCGQYPWAKAQRDAVVRAAAPYLRLSDDQLWQLVPGQQVPRAIDVSMWKGRRPGCPRCGQQINRYGNYPYQPDVLGRPWKLTCPSCQAVFPTNDFGRYLASGLDERGCFDPARADKALLFNAEHPDANDPLHKYGVDDGFGYHDSQGHRYLFVGYFTWKLWGVLRGMVATLSNAYLYTGEQVYAHKALVLLDRIADVYPEYDLAPYRKLDYYHSDGGSGAGKIEGRIWETGVVHTFAEAVDRCLPGTVNDPELLAFLAAKAKQYRTPRPKGTRELLVANLDEGLLREGAKAVFAKQAWGNEGMHQTALAWCAVALDTEPETSRWLDFLFAPDGGNIPGVVVSQVDRDGVGAEAAPGYALSWGANLGQVADLLADYGKYTRHDIYRDLPSFAATFTAGWRLAVAGYATPSTGDSSHLGGTGVVAASPAFIIRGYKYLKDPSIALAAYWANGGRADGLGRDLFSADPERIERETAALAKAAPANPFAGGRNLTGYGQASLSLGWGRGATSVWLYYGRNAGHGHRDRLNFDVIDGGVCLLPDHGYPEYATRWPHRMYVTDNTIAHNTVVVDESPQRTNWVGHPELFAQLPHFGAVRVDSREVYPNLKQYQRTLAQIQVGEGPAAYVFDVFRVRGGNDHVYSLHGLPGTVATTGLNLVAQQRGTYAGEDTEFRSEVPPRHGPKFGYTWLTNVARDRRPAESFVVDWHGVPPYPNLTDQDNRHVRCHWFAPLSDVALADMQPPQNRANAPKFLRYLLAHRRGTNLTSTFCALIEPHRGQPLITRAERLPLVSAPDGAEAVALMVTLADGAVDYLVASDSDEGLVKCANGLEFAGAVGWLRTRGGKPVEAALCRGSRLALGEFALAGNSAGHRGKVVAFDQQLASNGHLWVDTPLPTDGSLRGAQLIIANDRQRNACYTIESVERDGDRTRIGVGRVSFIRGYRDPNDYAKGFVYEFAVGAEFIIPATRHWKESK